MSGYVCTFAGGKGGVGKTTTAIDVGAALGSAGRDVVVVDADLGMANVAGLLGLDPDLTVHDVLAGGAAVGEALIETRDLTVLPGGRSLEAFAAADPAQLRSVVDTLRDRYEVVLVDTEAGLSHEVTVPLGLADGVVLVTTPDSVAVTDASKTADLAERVDGSVIGGLVTRAARPIDLNAVETRLEAPLLGAVPEDPAAARTEPMVTEAPGSDAARAYSLLARRLERVFFEGAEPTALERVYDPAWFEADDATAEDGQTNDTEDGEPSGTDDGDEGEAGDGRDGRDGTDGGDGTDGDEGDDGNGGIGFAGLWTG
jgi:septum site-determining protein MinD